MHPSQLTINDLTLTVYEKKGKGLPIVFVHGNSSNAHAFESIWEDKALNDFHLLALDLPGHGSSDFADSSQYTFLSLGKIVAEFIHQNKLKEVVLVGHSLGGHVNMQALRFTDRVRGMMMLGTAPLANAAAMAEGYILSQDIMPLFKKEATDEELTKMLEVEVCDEKFHPIIRDSYLKTDGLCRETIAVELGTFFSSQDFVSEVSLLQKPGLQVAFAWGEHERLINKKYLENLPIQIWKNQVHVVKESAHFPMLENPGVFVGLVAGFAHDVEKTVKS